LAAAVVCGIGLRVAESSYRPLDWIGLISFAVAGMLVYRVFAGSPLRPVSET
jgi:hypothetical protein